jgi:hypothetical protein
VSAGATPRDALALVTHATSRCRLDEVRVVAARLDWSADPALTAAVEALDHNPPCTTDPAYAAPPGGP